MVDTAIRVGDTRCVSGDVELLEAWQGGDRAAGKELFERYYALLVRFFANKIGGDPMDLVQETFLGCVAGQTRLRDRRNFRSFLFGIAYNQLRKYYERQRAHQERVDPSSDSVADLAPGPSSLLTEGAEQKLLLDALRRIHAKGWVPSQKMGKSGVAAPYNARNGGGYTLEAELGISPNGYAEPDYLGWEVKQYGVRDFVKYLAKSPVTLMTPEPTGGLYRDDGVEAFLRRYGYPDKSGKEGRINFGGVYASGRDFHADTGLKLVLEGFDPDKGKITDVDGQIALIDREDVVAASWGFKGVIGHWNRKHAKAVYVPSQMRGPPPEYSYGARVELCEGSDVLLLLQALASGAVYYDPGIKMERADTPSPMTKRRSQFRVKHTSLSGLYQTNHSEHLDR